MKTIYKWTIIELFHKNEAIDYSLADKLSEEGWVQKQTEVRFNHRNSIMYAYTLWEKEVPR